MKLTVKKELVVKLFEKLGFKTAKDWDAKRLQGKIKQLPELLEGTKIKIKSDKAKSLLKALLKATEVQFKGEAEPTSKATPEKKKKDTPEKKKSEAEPKVSKKEKSKAKVKAKAEPKKKAEVDAFGRRLGTQGALIDEHITKKPKSIETLAKECKLSAGRISTHVRDLVEKKFITKDKKDKYALKQ